MMGKSTDQALQSLWWRVLHFSVPSPIPPRLMEIEQREASVHAIPGGEGVAQPHPPWGGETTRRQTYPSISTTYYPGQQQSSPPGEAAWSL